MILIKKSLVPYICACSINEDFRKHSSFHQVISYSHTDLKPNEAYPEPKQGSNSLFSLVSNYAKPYSLLDALWNNGLNTPNESSYAH